MNERSVHLIPGLSVRDVEVLDLQTYRFRRPLLVPLRTAHGEIADRDTVIVRVDAVVGGFDVSGWGEAALLPGWGTDTMAQVRFELERIGDMAYAGFASTPTKLAATLQMATARFALSSALLDAVGHARHRPVRQLVDPDASSTVPVNATIGICDLDEAVEHAVDAWQEGFRTLKLKVGDAADVARVRAVRSALPEVALRLDANAAWTLDEAVARLEALAELEIDYVEQPVLDAEALGTLRGRAPIRIAADESCLPIAAAATLVERGAVDVLVLKPALLGGWDEVCTLVELARAAGIDVVFTSALESAIGRTITAQMASAMLPGVTCGLATGWFDRDLRAGEDPLRGGQFFLGSGNGMGFVPQLEDSEER